MDYAHRDRVRLQVVSRVDRKTKLHGLKIMFNFCSAIRGSFVYGHRFSTSITNPT
ncbi:unnamed protein product, partial [Trichogramma brassicae]